jgi:DNA-binding beta-propeller fold protein YncE
MRPHAAILPLLLLASPTHATPPPTATPLPLPDGTPGIGFDDLRFSAPPLSRLLIPAGRTGTLDLIDPSTRAITPIAGFTRLPRYDAGHGQSVTSVDYDGAHFLFATDRTALSLAVVDPTTKRIVARAPLASAPDYVRYVAATHEVWVTEPGKSRIEIFSLPPTQTPTPTHAAFIPVPGGPESLVIDNAHDRAYTHHWKHATVAIALRSHAVVATFPAGCNAPRGIHLDAPRGFLFVGCEDGTAAVLDVAHDGKLVSTAKSGGSGVDIIAYDANLAHLYVPGDESATMAILGVSSKGQLSLLGTVPTVKDAHCVTSDDRGNAYVCDPQHGQLLVIHDSYPPQR